MELGPYMMLTMALESLDRKWAWGPFGLGIRKGVPPAFEFHEDWRTCTWASMEGSVIGDSEGEPEILHGPPETWEMFAERCSRQLGKGSRVFYVKQVGAEKNAPGFVMVISPGPFRADLIAEAARMVGEDAGVPREPESGT